MSVECLQCDLVYTENKDGCPNCGCEGYEQPESLETPKSALDEQVGGSHYKQFAIQPTEYSQKNKLNWCEGNIVKYASRHRLKNGAEDIRKVIHYAKLLLELEYGETE